MKKGKDMVCQSYHVYAVLTTTFWAFSNALTGIAMQSFSTLALTYWRYAIAAVCLLAVILVKKIRMPERRDIPIFFFCGALGFFLYTVFFNLGCRNTTAAVSSTIIATVPMITATAAGIFMKEKLCRGQWGGIFLAFAGVLILVFRPESLKFVPGTGWLVIAAFFLSAYNLLQRKITDKYSALQTSAYSILSGFLLLCVFAPTAWEQAEQAPVRAWICVAIMGIFSSATAYVCWAKAFSIAPKISSVTNYMFLTPFVAAILGFFISGELLTVRNALGGMVILAGLLLFQKNGK